jgi:hypothetical protein
VPVAVFVVLVRDQLVRAVVLTLEPSDAIDLPREFVRGLLVAVALVLPVPQMQRVHCV